MLPFICLPTRVITDPAVTAPALRVFCLLATYADRDGWCWPTLRTLGDQLGVTRAAVHNMVAHLVKLGHVERAQMKLPSGVTVTAYRPLMDTEKKAARKAFEKGAGRTPSVYNRTPKAAKTVHARCTMEVETSKKREDGPRPASQRMERAGRSGPTHIGVVLKSEAELDDLFGSAGVTGA